MYGLLNNYIIPKAPVTAPGGRGDEILAMMTSEELTAFAERNEEMVMLIGLAGCAGRTAKSR
jgi:hypothetical protein